MDFSTYTNSLSTLTTAQVQALTRTDLASLSVAQATAVNAAFIGALLPSQIPGFATDDLVLLTTTAIAAITRLSISVGLR